MKILYIHVPYNMMKAPTHWNPELVLELSVAQTEGHTLGLIDNAMLRYDPEVLQKHAEGVEPEKIILYGGIDQFRYLKEYRSFFPDAVIQGFPKEVLSDLPIEQGHIPPLDHPEDLPYPEWGFLPLVEYFQNSAIPFCMDTAILERRGTLKTQWNDIVQPIDKVGESLRYLRIVYNYDYISFQDDFSVDIERTYELLETLESVELLNLFYWDCHADIAKITRPILTNFRRAGCRMIYYNPIDITELRHSQTKNRLETAIHSTKATGLIPIIHCTLGHPDTNREDILRAVSLLKAYDPIQQIEFAKPYPGTPAYLELEDEGIIEIEDMEHYILDINESFVNHTQWSDIELLGILNLMHSRDTKRIEWIRDP